MTTEQHPLERRAVIILVQQVSERQVLLATTRASWVVHTVREIGAPPSTVVNSSAHSASSSRRTDTSATEGRF